MLDKSDTDVVRAWLVAALESGQKKRQTKTGLAQHCGVTRQAVTGWLATGRISKSHLTKASTYFGHSPTFAAGAEPAPADRLETLFVREEVAVYGWPCNRTVEGTDKFLLTRNQLAAVLDEDAVVAKSTISAFRKSAEQ